MKTLLLNTIKFNMFNVKSYNYDSISCHLNTTLEPETAIESLRGYGRDCRDLNIIS